MKKVEEYFLIKDIKKVGEKGQIFNYFDIQNKADLQKALNDNFLIPFNEINIEKNYSVFFWDINKILSYDALFNFIVGNRGAGKTYGCKKYVIQRFLKYKKQFIYLRRFAKELKKIKKFFDAVSKEFPNVKFKVKGKDFYINDELAGYCQELSTATIEKSNEFPEVETIIFDEFIIDKGVYHYLPDEVTAFNEFYETVARLRDVRVFFLSNAITMINPYFIYYNIAVPFNDKKISVNNDKLIQIYNNEGFIKLKKQTRFGKLIDGTEYGNYNMHNEFLRDNETFIKKKSGNCQLFFTFKYKSDTFGVWRNLKEGECFVSNDIDPTHKITYCITKSDLEPNLILLTSLKQSKYFKAFLKYFEYGCVYYESQKIKQAVYEVVKMASIY